MSENTGNTPEEALSFLEQTDKAYGKNTSESIAPKQTPVEPTSLGQATVPETPASTISGANDSFWKNIPLENLPSAGNFYPDDTEITVRAANVGEVRHWSTIDEGDMLDVDDKLNFILEKCIRIKTKSASTWLSWRDIADVDRMYLEFAIHEYTFPNKENVLITKFECENTCEGDSKYTTEVRTTSSLIQSFDMPDEISVYYKPEYKCFEVVSEKLNETFHLYAPTLGAVERIRQKISLDRKKNKTIDKAFIKIVPYLVQDWSSFDEKAFNALRNESMSWHGNKFAFITRFAELFQQAKPNSVYLECPKCGSKMTSSLFLGSGFTIKSLFLVSGRLNELV